jgi:hypothetical protein
MPSFLQKYFVVGSMVSLHYITPVQANANPGNPSVTRLIHKIWWLAMEKVNQKKKQGKWRRFLRNSLSVCTL